MLVSVEDLQDYMSGVQFDNAQYVEAVSVLSGLQNDLESFLNRKLEPTLILDRQQARGDGSLYIRYTPVLKFISLTTWDGVDLPLSSVTVPSVPGLTDDEYATYPGVVGQADLTYGDFRGDIPTGYGTIGTNMFGRGFFLPGMWYVQKYISCYGECTDQAVLAIKRIAARDMIRNHDDTKSIKGGTINADNGNQEDSTPLGWTDTELERFRFHRRRVVM